MNSTSALPTPPAANAATPFGVTFQAALANSPEDSRPGAGSSTRPSDVIGDGQPQSAQTAPNFPAALGGRSASAGKDRASAKNDAASSQDGTASGTNSAAPKVETAAGTGSESLAGSGTTALPLNFTPPVAFGAVPYVAPAATWTCATVQTATEGTVAQTSAQTTPISTTATEAAPQTAWSGTILPASVVAPLQIPVSSAAAPAVQAAAVQAPTAQAPTAPRIASPQPVAGPARRGTFAPRSTAIFNSVATTAPSANPSSATASAASSAARNAAAASSAARNAAAASATASSDASTQSIQLESSPSSDPTRLMVAQTSFSEVRPLRSAADSSTLSTPGISNSTAVPALRSNPPRPASASRASETASQLVSQKPVPAATPAAAQQPPAATPLTTAPAPASSLGVPDASASANSVAVAPESDVANPSERWLAQGTSVSTRDALAAGASDSVASMPQTAPAAATAPRAVALVSPAVDTTQQAFPESSDIASAAASPSDSRTAPSVAQASMPPTGLATSYRSAAAVASSAKPSAVAGHDSSSSIDVSPRTSATPPQATVPTSATAAPAKQVDPKPASIGDSNREGSAPAASSPAASAQTTGAAVAQAAGQMLSAQAIGPMLSAQAIGPMLSAQAAGQMLSAQTAQAISGAVSSVLPINSDSVPSAGKPAQKLSLESVGAKSSGLADKSDRAVAAGDAPSQSGQNNTQGGSVSGQHAQPGGPQIPAAASNGTASGVAQASVIASHASAHASATPLRGSDNLSDASRQTSQQAGATASHVENDETTASSGINSARVLQSMSESEMRVGMHSAEFGNISIRTSVSQQQMQTQISLDHNDLSQAIASHIGNVQTKLGSEYGLNASIQVNHQGASSSGHSGDSQPREQRAFSPTGRAEIGMASVEPDVVVPAGAWIGADSGHRLDIQA